MAYFLEAKLHEEVVDVGVQIGLLHNDGSGTALGGAGIEVVQAEADGGRPTSKYCRFRSLMLITEQSHPGASVSAGGGGGGVTKGA